MLCGCHERDAAARAPAASAPKSEPLAPPAVATVKRHRRAPPRRSETVLVVAPEYPPPLPADTSEFSFWLFTPYITKGSRFEVGKLDSIARSSCFLAESGRVIAARGAEPAMFDQETAGHRFTLYPSSPLEPDHWYALLVQGDDFLRVAEPTAPVSGDTAASLWPFFTGSAPRIVSVVRDDTSEPPSLELTLSEPLKVTTELCRTLASDLRDPSDRDCEAQRGSFATKLHLTLKAAATAPRSPLTLTLPAKARGNARSVAEGAIARHRTDDPPGLTLSDADFALCAAKRCWREPLPRELSSAPRSCH